MERTTVAFSMVALVFQLAVFGFYVAVMWRLFTKAGREGWLALIPLVNTYTLIKVAGRPGSWILLPFLPWMPWFLVGLWVGSDPYNEISAGWGWALLTWTLVSGVVALVAMVLVMIGLADGFGQGSGFAVGLILLPWIFLPILAFGPYRYGSWSSARRVRSQGYGPYGSGFAAPTHGIPAPTRTLQQTASMTPAPPVPGPPRLQPTARTTGLPPLGDGTTPPGAGAPAAGSQTPASPPGVSWPTPGAHEPETPVAGWYEDPAGSGDLRFWNGTGWTDRTEPRT